MTALFGSAVDGLWWWPFVVLVVSVALIVVLITVVRLHAFLALILAAIAAGLLAARLPGGAGRSHWVQAVELTTQEFGVMAGKVAVVIALASVIGLCLMESGAADKVVRRFLAVFGERRAGSAMFLSSYVISIPIFFDTVFMLLLPLARAMALRTGKDYLLYVMAICTAGIVTHSLCAPHPGPLAMAEALQVDLGLSIIVGVVLGIVPASAGWVVANWLNRRYPIPLRETAGAPLADLQTIMRKDERELPAFGWAITPIVLPIFLISLASLFEAALKQPDTFPWLIGLCGGRAAFPTVALWVEFIGNRNVALLLGTVVAMGLLMRQRRVTVAKVCQWIGPPLETAGVIILITSAGGAFGLMLKNAGVGDAIKTAAEGREINLIFLAWLVAAVIRLAQGSATVAMLTTSAMVLPLMQAGLPYHPIYIFLAIGFGAMICSWMNDSGFWVVGRLSGFTEQETLRSWTVIATVNSVAGLAVTWLVAVLLPMAAR
ncbi:MAG: GntP family permease [Verrucomicrobia bacterium]|nr:GntP family permease [Verrucomicrobiota bacterium]